MRIWSIHPRYLDVKGLVALWRETLLAQAVLHGETKGYTNHPQLWRFKQLQEPQQAIAQYLHEVLRESVQRGYCFDPSKVRSWSTEQRILVTHGQVQYEQQHLLAKLQVRDPKRYEQLYSDMTISELHPMFKAVPGEIEAWEKL